MAPANEAVGIRFDDGPRGLRSFIGPMASYFRDPMQFLEQQVADKGRASAFRMGGATFYVFTAPELVERVLVRAAGRYGKGPVLKNLREFFGDGLFVSEGEAWRERRRRVTPAFSRDLLPQHERDVNETTGVWLDRQLARARGRGLELDAYPAMLDLSREIMVKILFGDRSSAAETLEAVETGKAFDEVNRFFQYTLTPAGFFLRRLPGLRRWRYLRAVARLDRMIARYMEKRPAGPRSLLSLIEASEPSGKLVRDHMLTLYFGGHESTGCTLTSALWMMLEHPAQHARLVEEARSGGSGEALEAFLNETMRLYPPVWCLARQAVSEDVVTFEGAEHHIRRGAIVFIPVWSIHRDARNYPDPLTFDPSRWQGLDPSSLARGTYLPFGLGPRMCIGAAMAWMELKAILGAILRRFDLAVAPGAGLPPLAVTGALTIRPRHSLRIALRPVV